MSEEVNYNAYIRAITKVLDENCALDVHYDHHGTGEGIHPTTMTVTLATQSDDRYFRFTFPNSSYLNPTMSWGWLSGQNFNPSVDMDVRWSFKQNISMFNSWLNTR